MPLFEPVAQIQTTQESAASQLGQRARTKDTTSCLNLQLFEIDPPQTNSIPRINPEQRQQNRNPTFRTTPNSLTSLRRSTLIEPKSQ